MAYAGNKVKISLGSQGLLTDISTDTAPQESLIRATNVCYFNGAVEKAPGSLRWNATAVSAGIVGAHYFLPNLISPRYVIVTSDGKIYKGRERVFGNPIATVSGVMPLTPNCVFAEGGAEQALNNKKLFLFTEGTTLPYVISGDATTATTLSRPNSDWTATKTYPKFGLVHRSQLWAFAGQISYASDPLNHEDFSNSTTGITEPVYPGEGGELRGAFVYKGRMFAFKDGGFVYGLIDTDSDVTNWYWTKVASNFGLAAPNAIAEVLDDMLAGNTYGTITSYTASQQLGNVEAADIVQQAQFETYMRNSTSKSGVPHEHLLYYGEKKLLFMTCRTGYSTTNDSLIVLDFGRGGRIRPAVWQKGTPQCLAMYKDINQVERPMYGDNAGFLNLMDYEDRSEGTASFTGGFQTQHMDLSSAFQALSYDAPKASSAEKQFDFIAVHYIPASAGNLSCDYFIDGRYIDTITFPMIQYQRPELGTLLLGTDRLAQSNTETAIRPICGAGRTISAYFYNSGANQSFQIPAITVYFRGGGDKAQQV